MKDFFYKGFLLAALIFGMNSSARAGDTLRVLFVGNSYTFVNDLPKLVGDLATANGDFFISASSTPGGSTLQQHTTNPTTLSLIAQGNWDYVVLQEQSQLPSFPEQQVEVEFYPFARKMDSLIKAANSCTKTVFYMTWGRKNGDPSNCAFFPPVCTYQGMDSMLQLRYTNVADSNHAWISPVARVWRKIRTVNPGLELYDADQSHPSLAGSYAAACSFYSVFYKKSPIKISFDAGLTAPEATLIKTVAKQVVFDSLTYWYRFNPLPKASLTFVKTGASVSFTNTSKYSDKYLWIFGDGNVDTTKNPTHVYTKDTVYMVRLVAKKCKDSDTLLLPLVVGATGVQAQVNSNLVSIYPNPVLRVLHLHAPVSIQALSLFDLSGKLIYVNRDVNAKEVEVDMKDFPLGTYHIAILTKEGINHQLVTKSR